MNLKQQAEFRAVVAELADVRRQLHALKELVERVIQNSNKRTKKAGDA